MEPIISVIIATFNRQDYLKRAIHGLLNQSLSADKYEILIVDNASTDDTREVVLELSKNAQNLHYLYESRPGSNIARNTGLAAAKGQYVAFTDDDAVPYSDWLHNILLSFQQIQPEPAIVGGKVLPVWEAPKPKWMHERMLTAISLIDYGESPKILANKFLFSVNMAFPTSLLRKYGGFDTRIFRKGYSLVTNDEILIALKLKKDGYTFFYNPKVVVDHYIPASRLNRKWFIKRCFAQGYSDALMWKYLESPGAVRWMKELLFHIYIFIRNPRYIIRLFLNPTNPDLLYIKLVAHIRLGYIKGLFY